MLAAKVLELERDVVTARRIAEFWRKQITLHGEPKAEAFYRSLGLNHLEIKSFEWEGLTLAREPNEAEKLCVKGIAEAQETGKAAVTNTLLNMRNDLIDDGMAQIRNLKPADYHSLVLDVPELAKTQLKGQGGRIFNRGRRLVSVELGRKQAIDDEDDEDLDDLVDLTGSRVANDVQSRITGAAARFALLGLTGAALWKAVRQEIEAGSVSYIDRTATGFANQVLSMGREREADDRSDEWDRVEYSALLDVNTCGPCAQADGDTANDEADLDPAPNPECEGGDFCRCFHVYINQ